MMIRNILFNLMRTIYKIRFKITIHQTTKVNRFSYLEFNIQMKQPMIILIIIINYKKYNWFIRIKDQCLSIERDNEIEDPQSLIYNVT